jgi:Na+-driven multidrug efflux pump
MFKPKLTLIALSACLATHLTLTYLFIIVLNLGVYGVCIATNISYFVAFFFITILCKCNPQLQESFFFPSKNVFLKVKDYLAIGIPAIFITFFEYITLEFLVLIASYLTIKENAT